MHTPTEAHQLWCPMVRVATRAPIGKQALSLNNDGTELIPENCCCIADQCSMWRWEFTTESIPVLHPNGATIYEQRVVKTHGYCGLAGTPS